MSNLNWKTLSQDSISSLQNTPSIYIHALTVKKQWKTLLESAYLTQFSPYVLSSLKKASVLKQVFKSSTVEEVLGYLDSSNDPIRKQILHILIRTFDSSKISEGIGKILIENIKDHQWGYSFLKEIISLQSSSNLKIACHDFI